MQCIPLSLHERHPTTRTPARVLSPAHRDSKNFTQRIAAGVKGGNVAVEKPSPILIVKSRAEQITPSILRRDRLLRSLVTGSFHLYRLFAVRRPRPNACILEVAPYCARLRSFTQRHTKGRPFICLQFLIMNTGPLALPVLLTLKRKKMFTWLSQMSMVISKHDVVSWTAHEESRCV